MNTERLNANARRHSQQGRNLISLALALLSCSSLAANKKKPSLLPDFPKINLTTWYEVDPTWPKRPPGVKWAAVPGIAVDSQDQVWVYTRTNPPVQVYDAQGNYLRGWGKEQIRSAHHLKIDRDGNIWVADIGSHLVMKFSPDGKLLLELGTRDQAGCDEQHLKMPTDMAVTTQGEIWQMSKKGEPMGCPPKDQLFARFSPEGKLLELWTVPKGKDGREHPGELNWVHSIALDSKGNIYAGDIIGKRAQKFIRHQSDPGEPLKIHLIP